MTRRAAGVLLALLACSTFAEADMTTPDGKDRNLPCARDGVYWKEPPPGRAVPFRERHLYSVANPNDRYTLTVIAPPQTERHEALLCLGGRVLGERSWGGDSTAAYFDFHLSRSEADAVAAALHLERRDRRRLGQGLKWQFA